VGEAIERVAELSVPRELQAGEFSHVLATIAEEGSRDNRAVCLRFAVKLFIDGAFARSELVPGLEKLAANYEDITIDLPSLPRILREECLPALEELVRADLMTSEQHQAFCKRIR